MPLAFSNLTAGRSASEPAVTASITPAAGGMVLLTVSFFRATLDAAPPTDAITVSGLSGTWIKLGTVIGGSSDLGRAWLFQGTNLTGSGTITIDYTGPGSIVDVAWVVDQVTGQAALSPVTHIGTASVTGATITPTTVGTPGTGDATYSSVATDVNTDCTPEAGWTALGTNTEIRRVESAYDATSPIDTSCAWSIGGSLVKGLSFICIVRTTSSVAVYPAAQGNSNTDPATTASFAPYPNAVVLLSFVIILSSGNPSDSVTVSGLSGTWTKLATGLNGTSGRSWLFLGTNVSGSGAITIDYTGTGTFSSVSWAADQVTGADTTTPVSDVADNSGTSPFAVTTTGTPDTGDITYSSCSITSSNTTTPESGWTASSNSGTSSPRVASAYDDVAAIDTSCTWTTGGNNRAFIGIINIATSGQTFQRTLSATATHVSTLTRRLSLKRPLTRTTTGVATMTKRAISLRRAFVVVATTTAFLLRRNTRRFTVSATGVPQLTNRLVTIRSLAATAGSVVSLVRKKTSARSLVAAASNVVTLTRRPTIRRVFSVTTAGVATFIKKTRRTLSLSSLVERSMFKRDIPFTSQPRTAKVRSLRSTAIEANLGELTDWGTATSPTTTTTANFAIGDTSERYRNATTSVAASPPAVGTASTGQGWRDAVALNTAERTRYDAGTWTLRWKIRKTGQIVVVNVTIRLTWIMYRVSSSGTFIQEIGRGVSADHIIGADDVHFSTSFTTSVPTTFEAGEKVQIEIYVQNIVLGSPTAATAAYNIVLLQDQPEEVLVYAGTGLTAQPNYIIFYARAISVLTSHVVALTKRLLNIRRSLVAVATGVVSIRRKTAKRITATGVGVASIRRKITRRLTATATGTASLRKMLRRTILATTTGLARFTKRITKRLVALGTGTASLARALRFRRGLTAASAVLAKAFAKMPFHLIPLGGGVIIRQVKKFFPVFDD